MAFTFGPSSPDAFSRSEDMAGLGHLLDIRIEPLLTGRAGAPNTTSGLAARGLIDTGASDVCIDTHLAAELGLLEVAQQLVGVVGDTRLASVYAGVLDVPQVGFRKIMPFYGLRLRRATHEVLLGRSFLRHFIVTSDGPSGMFHFAQPVTSHIEEPFDE